MMGSKFQYVSFTGVPGNVTITLMNRTEVESDGTPYELRCDVYDIAPVQHLTIRWFRQNITVNESRFLETEIRPRNVSASLLIYPTDDDNGVQYRCEAGLDLGPHSSPNVSSDPLYIVMKSKFVTLVYLSPSTIYCTAGKYRDSEHLALCSHRGFTPVE